MKKCNLCNKLNSDEAIYCKYCKNELNQFIISCPNCGSTVEPNAKFCKICGYNIVKLNQPSEPNSKSDKKLIITISTISIFILMSIIVLLIFIFKHSGNTMILPDTLASETTGSSVETDSTSTSTITDTISPPEMESPTNFPEEAETMETLLESKGKIAFQSDRDGDFDIYIMNVNGAEQQKLTNNNYDDKYPVFSADGSKIFFASNINGTFEIWVMNIDGSDIT